MSNVVSDSVHQMEFIDLTLFGRFTKKGKLSLLHFFFEIQ